VELGFGADDVMALVANSAKNGISFKGPVREVHGKKIATFLDAYGAPCSLSGA